MGFDDRHWIQTVLLGKGELMSLRPKWNLLLNSVIAAAFLVTAATGLVFFFGLAGAGFQGGRAATQSWLLARDGWRSLHEWFGLAMVGGVVVHLIVHWKWIAATVKRNVLGAFSARRAAGAPVLAAVPENRTAHQPPQAGIRFPG